VHIPAVAGEQNFCINLKGGAGIVEASKGNGTQSAAQVRVGVEEFEVWAGAILSPQYGRNMQVAVSVLFAMADLVACLRAWYTI